MTKKEVKRLVELLNSEITRIDKKLENMDNDLVKQVATYYFAMQKGIEEAIKIIEREGNK